jgi:hypothetical protein
MRGSIQRQVSSRRPSGTPMHTGGSWWQRLEGESEAAYEARFYGEVARRNTELQSSRFGKVPGSLVHGPSEHLASLKPSKKWQEL